MEITSASQVLYIVIEVRIMSIKCNIVPLVYLKLKKLMLMSPQVPNAFGTGLGLAQLILYAIYCKNRNHPENAIKDDFTEMDLEKIDQSKKPDSRHL